ncbi:acyl-CoA thioesterase [Mycobacterium aquaticum]|uniref:Acyl-CoA thioesterase II n=1 Tax=Mycobacterium aquaticum TaxID=1927124 RepID=A0A1X0B5V9_9MYCO|nr:acyl-CoA thioesterase domain-containing protein [Mycobacterium aquaticum]ORA37724.1 acyl-CoA thioesterase II [Mycobacterium aquaticum]
MSTLLKLLDVPADGDGYLGESVGPDGKRAYGGQLAAQSLAAACRTVEAERSPTNVHVQFLRGGDAGAPVRYRVQRLYDGRTAAARRVESYQGDRLLTAATVSFATELPGPEHGHVPLPGDPEALCHTGPPGPAPSLPLGEFDIRVDDTGAADAFVRRFWWRVVTDLPADPRLHALVAVYITDLYGIDPVLAVHGHSMRSRAFRSGTTDSAIWFHRPVRADRWNLLEARSPAAARGRGVATASLIGSDGSVAATLVQEGLVAERPAP